MTPALHVGDTGQPTGRRVEIRCPVPFIYRDGSEHPGKMFMVLYLGPGEPDPAAIIELPCSICRKRLRARKALHRYNLAGDLIGTVAEQEEQ